MVWNKAYLWRIDAFDVQGYPRRLNSSSTSLAFSGQCPVPSSANRLMKSLALASRRFALLHNQKPGHCYQNSHEFSQQSKTEGRDISVDRPLVFHMSRTVLSKMSRSSSVNSYPRDAAEILLDAFLNLGYAMLHVFCHLSRYGTASPVKPCKVPSLQATRCSKISKEDRLKEHKQGRDHWTCFRMSHPESEARCLAEPEDQERCIAELTIDISQTCWHMFEPCCYPQFLFFLLYFAEAS